MRDPDTGYPEALKIILTQLRPLASTALSLDRAEGFNLAADVTALVDSPSVDTSMKDGYALRAGDAPTGDTHAPRPLEITGRVAAGGAPPRQLEPFTALRILTGGALPPGADTIVAEEFVRVVEGYVQVTRSTERGRNIRRRGSDTTAGERLFSARQPLTPGAIGLLAAAGHDAARVHPKPRVAIIATGDEVLLPGQPLSSGKLYASNLLTINAWCRRFGMPTTVGVVGDRTSALVERLERAAREQDVVITSGGAWTGDKDLVAHALAELGWRPHFHRLRLGPGKAAGFGFLQAKPVFLLPGGPPSNLVAFLLLALPGLLRLDGSEPPGLPRVQAKLAAPVAGDRDWSQALFGDLETTTQALVFNPHQRRGSRLKRMARARGLLMIPEGQDGYAAGDIVSVQLLC